MEVAVIDERNEQIGKATQVGGPRKAIELLLQGPVGAVGVDAEFVGDLALLCLEADQRQRAAVLECAALSARQLRSLLDGVPGSGRNAEDRVDGVRNQVPGGHEGALQRVAGRVGKCRGLAHLVERGERLDFADARAQHPIAASFEVTVIRRDGVPVQKSRR